MLCGPPIQRWANEEYENGPSGLISENSAKSLDPLEMLVMQLRADRRYQ